MKTKACSRCKIVKQIPEFGLRPGRPNGLSRCKSCMSIYNKELRMKHPGRYKEAQKLYRESNKKNGKRYEYLYGITLADYNALCELQENKCKICNLPQLTYRRKLSVDHCHKSKKVRGLLCDNCNIGLGKFRDDPKTLLNAIKYLKGSK